MDVRNIHSGQEADGQFEVLSAIFVQGQKKPRVDLTLGDKTGVLAAVYWEPTKAQADELTSSPYLIARGPVKEFQGRPQLLIDSYVSVASVDDPSEYEMCAPVPLSDLTKRRDALIGFVKDVHLKRLLQAILIEDSKIATAFIDFPAAKSRHHAYKHGLLYHSIEVASDAYDYGRKMKNRGVERPIHLDLLLTAGLLHDIGKVVELERTGPRSFDYSFGGNLFGHIELGIRLIDEKIRVIEDFPTRLADLLRHMIEAHHGLKAWGSIQEPGFLEAHLLHAFDSLSSQVAYFLEAEDQAAPGVTFVYSKKLEADGRPGRNVFTGMGDLLRDEEQS